MKKQERVKAIQIWRSAGMPRKRARRSFFADCDHRAPEWGTQDEAHQTDRQREAKQHEVIERIGIREDVDGRDAKVKRHARKSAQTVVAACQRTPLERDVVEDLSEGDGDHREIDTAPPRAERTEQRAGDPAEQRSAQKSERCARCNEFQREACAIRTQPEIRSVTKRQHAGEAEQKIHRHRRETQHEHPCAKRGVASERRHPVRGEQQHGPDRRKRDQSAVPRLSRCAHVSMPSSPSRPRGRSSSTTAIST
ncbi:hypothetical protein QFZ89_006520 [Paraburkholderia youngii]